MSLTRSYAGAPLVLCDYLGCPRGLEMGAYGQMDEAQAIGVFWDTYAAMGWSGVEVWPNVWRDYCADHEAPEVVPDPERVNAREAAEG